MEPLISDIDDFDTPEYLADRVSLALFGAGHLLETLQSVLRLEQPEFLARELDFKHTSLINALTRLGRWGLIERIGDAPARYVYTGRGNTVWELAEQIQRCLALTWRGAEDSHPPLSPPLGFAPKPWWGDRLDKTGSRLFAGSVARLSLLIRCYGREEPFWAARYSQIPCMLHLNELELAGMLTGYDFGHRDWPSWQRTTSPMWDVVPLLWRLMVENYPRPTPAANSTHPRLYPTNPALRLRTTRIANLPTI